MSNGLGELGFWLAVGVVVAAVIIAGAIKDRNSQAAARDAAEANRASRERTEAMRASLLENAGGNIPEVLAYLRERDAAAAARSEEMWRRQAVMERERKANEGRVMAFVAAFVVSFFAFIGGLVAADQHHGYVPRVVYSAQAGRMVLEPPPPPPTGWEAFLPVGAMLVVWAAGLIVAALILWRFGKRKHDAQPDA